jgi:hypothetical protein
VELFRNVPLTSAAGIHFLEAWAAANAVTSIIIPTANDR